MFNISKLQKYTDFKTPALTNWSGLWDDLTTKSAYHTAFERTKDKRRLLAYCFGCIVNTERKISDIAEYLPFYVLDFDHVPDTAAILNLECVRKFARIAFVSPSGDGVKVVVQSELAADAKTYREIYAILAGYFHEQTKHLIPAGMNRESLVDFATNDPTRLCFIPYRPDAYCNENAIVMEAALFPALKKEGGRNVELFKTAADMIDRGAKPEHVLKALTKQTTLPPREVAATIASAAEKGNIMLRTVREHYIWRDEITNFLYSDYDKIDDSELLAWYEDYIEAGEKMPKQRFMDYFSSKKIPHKNRVREYFNQIQPADNGAWDKMIAAVKLEHPEYAWTLVLKWFLSYVKAMTTGEVNQYCLVFQGAQGVGKTWLSSYFCPPELKEYTYSGTIEEKNKDTMALLATCVLINLDELENLNKSELGSMKEIITKELVVWRRPYERERISRPRLASFIGSVNNPEFLQDMTGNRRFLPVRLLAVNREAMPPIEDIFANVLFYVNDARSWFNADEMATLAQHQAEFLTVPAAVELLPCVWDLENGTEWRTAAEIADRVATFFPRMVNHLSSRQVGIALSARNTPKKIRDGYARYLVKPLDYDAPQVSVGGLSADKKSAADDCFGTLFVKDNA